MVFRLQRVKFFISKELVTGHLFIGEECKNSEFSTSSNSGAVRKMFFFYLYIIEDYSYYSIKGIIPWDY